MSRMEYMGQSDLKLHKDLPEECMEVVLTRDKTKCVCMNALILFEKYLLV